MSKFGFNLRQIDCDHSLLANFRFDFASRATHSGNREWLTFVFVVRAETDPASQPASETDRQTTMTPETTFIKVRLKWNIVHARFSNNDIAICSHLLDGGGRGDRRGGGVRHGCQIMRNKSELYCIYLSQFSLYLTYITYVALTLLFLSLFLSLFYHTFHTSIFHNVRTYSIHISFKHSYVHINSIYTTLAVQQYGLHTFFYIGIISI